jgi:hypothetical protein
MLWDAEEGAEKGENVRDVDVARDEVMDDGVLFDSGRLGSCDNEKADRSDDGGVAAGQ